MHFRLILVMLPALICGQSFFNRSIGLETQPFSIRAQGMGNTSAISAKGVTALLSNPVFLGDTESRIHAVLNFSGHSVFERRSIVLKDFFGDFLTEGDYVNNSYFLSNFMGGISYKAITGKINFDLGLYYGSLLSFDTKYREEVRGDLDCPEGIPCSRDILAGYHKFETSGQVNSFSGGMSLGMKIGMGRLNLGVARHQTMEADLNFVSGTDTLNFNMDNLSSIPNQNLHSSINTGSFYSIGSSLDFNNRLTFTISRENELLLNSTGIGNFGVFNEENMLIEYFVDCSTIQCLDSSNTQEPVALSQTLIKPEKTSIGFSYEPLNSIPMTIAIEYELRKYSSSSLVSLDQYKEFLLSADSDMSFNLQPDVNLNSHGSIKAGIEYTSISGSIIRTGLQYNESPMQGFSPQSILTFGFGKRYKHLSVDAAGYYKMVKYYYPDVFKVAGEYRQDYDTVHESVTGFSFGFTYSF